MTVEKQIFDALRALVADRVYPDVAPEDAVRPYVTYQCLGGFPVNFVEGGMPSQRNTRYRVNVWGDGRAAVSATSLAVEYALRNAASLQTTVMTNPVALNDPETRLRGTSQDFSFWTPVPS
jgi:hypothetical protein